MANQTDRHSYNKYSLKWVYSSEILAVQFLNMEYLNFWAGEIAPILVKIKGLFALLRIVKINHYSIPALTPFPIVQQTTCLSQ
jgi:hypothetical protein